MDTKYISEVIHPIAVTTGVNEWMQINFNFNENDGIRYLAVFSTPFRVDIRNLSINNNNMASNGRLAVNSVIILNEQVVDTTLPPLITTTVIDGVGLSNVATTFILRCDRLNNRILIRRASATNPHCTMIFTFNEVATT
jgi:hypothetical protein